MTKVKSAQEEYRLSEEDISALSDLIDSIEKAINEAVKKNPNLESKLKIRKRKRFIGELGEAIGLVKVFKKFGNSYKYEWYGGKKRDYDLILENNAKKIKIQIKTSADEKYRFWPLKVHIDKPDEIIEQIKNKVFDGIFKKIEEAIDNKDVDYWLFVHVKEGGAIYMVDKSGLKEICKEHYKRHYNRHVDEKKPRKGTHYGISIKDNSLRLVLEEEKTDDLFKEYNLIASTTSSGNLVPTSTRQN